MDDRAPNEVRKLVAHAVAVAASVRPGAWDRAGDRIQVDAAALHCLIEDLDVVVPGEVERAIARTSRR
jgi:hypothetical protein